MSKPSVPQPFRADTTMHFGNGVNVSIGGIKDDPIVLKSDSTARFGGIKDEPIVLNSDSTVKMGLDNIGIDIKHLPTIKFAMEPTRVHFPMHLRFGLSTLGIELLAFSICGESMIVIEDYVQKPAEHCG